jgi:hypothetical protein
MKAMLEAQELARRNNENEAVWRCYEHKRELRRLLGPDPGQSLPEDVLDDLDWQEAERECRPVRAIGFLHTNPEGHETKETH